MCMRYVQTSEIRLIIPPRWVCIRLHGPENFVKNEVFTQSPALFGPDAPPRLARRCPDAAPATDAPTDHHPHDPQPQTRDRNATSSMSPLDDARCVRAPAPGACRTA